jgi:hypothetical protein
MAEHGSPTPTSRSSLAAVAPALALACLLLAGCASKPEEIERRLGLFAADFAGSWETDPASSGVAEAGEEATRLGVVRIRVPLVAKHVFYVQESAASNPRRVFSQRVWSAVVTADGRAVGLTPHELVEPARWRDGDRDPDLFKAMLPQDLRARPECAIRWEENGSAWKGRADGPCRTAVSGTTQPLRLQTEAELGAEGLAFAERQLDTAGRVVQQRAGDPFRRYRRRGG